jgi:hypothetical protein
MKKILTFLLLISTVFLFNTLFAQQNNLFPDSIAFWIDQEETRCGDPGSCCGQSFPCSWLYVTCNKYKMQGDTTINLVNYKKIYRSYNEGTYYPCSVPTIGGGYVWERYFAGLREDSSKLYILLNGSTTENLLYDFSVQLGDTTETFSFLNSSYNVYFVYDSTFVDSIWGQLRNIRKMTGFVFLNSNFYFNYTDFWIEGIGSFKGFLWLQYNNFYKSRTCLDTYSELKNFSLSENSLTYQCRDSIFIEPPIYVNVDQIYFNNHFSISPNPTSQNLTLNFSNEHIVSFIRITDIQGKMLKAYNGFQENISVTDLNDGLYFLQVQFANGETAVKKIMKQ